MQEITTTLIVTLGPVIVLVAIASALFTPGLILNTPPLLRNILLGTGAIFVMIGLSFSSLGNVGWALALIGFVMLFEPALSYVVQYFKISR